MAYVPNRLEVKVTLDLNSNDLHDALEKLVHEAYREGYTQGVSRGVEQGRTTFPIEADYEDWRAFGPGNPLPGGAQFRSDLEQREALVRELNVDSRLNCPNCSEPTHARLCPECGTQVRHE